MQINKALNLVVPLDGGGYVHSTPIGREVFETYFLPISKTFSGIFAEGLNVLAGPRVASLMLKKVAVDMGVWDGVAGVGNGLMAEIRRLTNVLLPTESGWQTVPLDVALSRQMISQDDYAEAEGSIVFFICISAMHKRSLIEPTLAGMCSLWESQITSLNCTEFASSLPTSTETDSFGEMAQASAIPS